MSAAPFVVLGVVAISLAGTMAWEADRTGETLPPGRVWAADVELQVSAAGAAPLRTAGLVATILARPLFSPDRRQAVANVVAEVRPPPAVLPRLTGILVTSAGRSAIFAGELRATVVQEGAELGRFTVRSIEPGQVVVTGPGGERTVRPSFDPSRPAPVMQALSSLPGLPLRSALQPAAVGLAPATSAEPPGGPKEDMPFKQNPSPSGLDILRHAVNQNKNGTPAGQ